MEWLWPIRTGQTFFDVWTLFHLSFWFYMGSNFWSAEKFIGRPQAMVIGLVLSYAWEIFERFAERRWPDLWLSPEPHQYLGERSAHLRGWDVVGMVRPRQLEVLMSRTRIGFSTTNNPLSRIIRRFTGSECSHVWFVYFDEDFQQDMVMEAHWTYQLIPLKTFARKNKIVDIITPKYPIDDAVKSSVEWLGTAYDVSGLLGMSWVLLGRKLRHLWKNPFRSARNVYCSEAVTRGLLAAHYPLLNRGVDPEAVSPSDLITWFRRGN